MHILRDNQGRLTRLSEERLYHIESDHPEMESQFDRISETLTDPDRIIGSRTDEFVELFYKHYPITPVSSKFLCIVVKIIIDDNFIITAYYTDSIKRGKLIWEKK